MMTTFKKKNLVEETDYLMETNTEEMETTDTETNEENTEISKEEDNVYPIIVDKIIKAQVLLQEIDDYFNELPNLQSKVDEEIQDLLHYIENNDIPPKQSVKMIKLLHDKRKERRLLCNDFEIKKVYLDHKNKMITDGQRPFLLNTLRQKINGLKTQYRNRRYGEDEIPQLLKGR